MNPITILIIEDNLPDIRLIEELLKEVRQFAYQLFTAGTVKESCELIPKHPFDLILLDLSLPDSEGYQTFNSVINCCGNIPLVLVSGLKDEQLSIKLIKEGAQDYISKNSLTTVLLEKTILYSIERKKTELELLGAEEEFRLIAENTSDIIIVLDLNMNATYISPSVTKIRGFTIQEAIAQKLEEVFTPDSLQKIYALYEKAKTFELSGKLELHNDFTIELEVYHKNGSTFWTELAPSFIRDENHKPTGIVCVCRDISGRINAEKKIRAAEEEKFKKLFLLSETIRKINECVNIEEIYELICTEISHLLNNAVILISEIKDDDTLRVVKANGIEKYLERLKTISGYNLFQIDFRINDMTEEELNVFRSGELREISLFDLLTRRFSKPVCRACEKLLKIKNIYNAGFCWNSIQFGGLIIIAREDIPAEDLKTIEIINGQASLNMHRRRIENELRISEEKYSRAFLTSPYAITLTRLKDGRFIEVNDAFSLISGYTREESTVNSSVALKLWADLKDRNSIVSSLLRGKPVAGEEYLFRKKSGEILTGLFSAQIIDIHNERYILSSINDISERKKAEEKLKQSEHNLAEAERIGNNGSWNYDVATDTAVWSENMYRIFDVQMATPAGLISNDFISDIVHPDDRAEITAAFMDAMLGYRNYNFEYRIIRKDGEIRIIHAVAEIMRDENGNPIRVIGRVEDITEQKQVIEKLKISEHNLNEAERIGNSGNWDYDFATDKNVWSDNMHRILGVDTPTDKASNLHFFIEHVVHPDDKAGLISAYFNPLPGKYSYDHECRIIRNDGEIRNVHILAQVILDNNDSPVQIMGRVEDITDRKQVEQALQISYERLKEAQKNAKMGNWEADLHTGELYWSETIFDIFGLDSKTSIPDIKRFYDAVHPEDLEKVRESEKRSEQTGLYDVVHRIICPDNEVRYVHELARRLTDDKGNLVRLRGTVQDITERVKAEMELHESEARYRRITEEITDVVWTCDLNLNVTFISPSYKKLIGESSETAKTRKFEDRFPPGTMKRFSSMIIEEFENEKNPGCDKNRSRIIEVEHYNINGTVIWVEFKVSFLRDADGNAVGFQGVTRDITRRKKVEEALQQSEERFRNISTSISDISYSCVKYGNGTYKLDWLYGAVKKITGYSNDELKAMECWGKLVLEEDFGTFKKNILELSHGRQEISQLRIKNKNGEVIWIQASSRCIQQDGSDVTYVYGGISDITERKLFEEKLRKLSMAVEQNSTTIVITNLKGDIEYVNPKFTEVTGYSFEEAFGNNPRILQSGLKLREEYIALWATITSGGIWKGEFCNKKKNGEIFWESASISPITNESGIITHFVAVKEDITEHKKIQQALLRSEEKFRGIFENVNEGIYQTTPEGKYISVNPAFAAMLGFRTPEELIGSISDIGKELYVNPADRDRLRAILSEKNRVEGYEAQLKRKDGNTIWILISARTVRDDKGNILYFEGTNTDITQRKMMEDTLRENEEMYRSLTENLPVIVARFDKDFRHLFVNNAIKQYTGREPSEFIGKRNEEVGMPAENVKKWNEILHRVFSTGKPVSFEFEVMSDENKKYYLTTNAVPEFNKNGETVSVLCVTKDITDRIIAEHTIRVSETKFRALYENAPVPYQSVDENAIIIDVNPAWMKILGYEKDEVIGKRFPDFLTRQSQERYFDIFSKMKEEGVLHNIEFDFVSKTGKIINALFEGIFDYSPEGSFKRTYTTFKDVTQEKQINKIVSNAIINSEEKQRVVFAQELHDGLGPMLSSIKLFLKSMENRKEIETIEPIIDKVNYIIDESIIQLKELSHNLSPHILTNHGIDPALNDFISRITGTELKLNYESKLSGRLNNVIETAIYRVVTELITNTIKHANATRIDILLSEKENHIQVYYSDNGSGFEVASMLKSSKGSGLYNIINRMKAIDANYRFTSDLGKGFSFYANINII